MSNHAQNGGGLACVSLSGGSCTPRLDNCAFLRNRGEYQGGGLYRNGAGGAPFFISNCRFERNYCFQYGGGLAILDPLSDVRLYNCVFEKDSAHLETAGAYIESNLADSLCITVDSCVFNENYCFIGSAALVNSVLYSEGCIVRFNVNNCVFSMNRSVSNHGAGIYVFISQNAANLYTLNVTNSRFENNRTSQAGSGLMVEGGAGGHVNTIIDRCFFYKNLTSVSAAGAFYYRQAINNDPVYVTNTITNSVFAHNDGAITSLSGFVGVSHTRVANCTFFRNGRVPFLKYWSPDFGPTFYMDMQILNSVIWEPQVEGPHRLFYNNDFDNFNVHNYLVEHCLVNLDDCTYNGVDPCGEGMLYATWPEFEDTTALDFRIPPCSPAKNAASNTVADTFGLAADYPGAPRLWEHGRGYGRIRKRCSLHQHGRTSGRQ